MVGVCGRHPGSLCLPEKFGVFGGDQYINFPPERWDVFFFLRPNKTMGFYVLEHVTPVKFLGPSFWVSMFISGEGEKTPIVFLS